MNIHDYTSYISKETLMGPNSLRILEALLAQHPLQLSAQDTILDLGCGTGLSSLVAAKESGAKVTAVDLWIREEDNAKRFEDWKISGNVSPIRADANELSFEPKQFQAMISIDSYHYFGGHDGFFEEKILPFLDDKAVVLIGIPGIKDEYRGRSEDLLSPWLGEDAYMFKSHSQWKELMGAHPRISKVETCELDCFDLAWDEWFSSEHKYANGDKQHFESIIKPYTCFVGIYVELK